MNSVFTASEFPPSLAEHPLLVMVSIFGLLAGTILALQWAHRIGTDMIDDSYPWRHPLTLDRLVKLLIIGGALSRSVPRLVQVMAWGQLTPEQREYLSLQNWSVNIIWALLFAVAWWLDRMVSPATTFQLRRWRQPPAEVLEGSGKLRAALVMLGVMVIAFTATYVRPAQPYEQPRIILAR